MNVAPARLVSASGRVISTSAEQLMKQPHPMVERAAGRMSSRSEDAPRRELLPRLVRAASCPIFGGSEGNKHLHVTQRIASMKTSCDSVLKTQYV